MSSPTHTPKKSLTNALYSWRQETVELEKDQTRLQE